MIPFRWAWDGVKRIAGSGSKSLSINRLEEDFVPQDAVFRGGIPRTNYPYRRDVGLGLHSNVVMSPVNWILRNFTESDLVKERRTEDVWERVEDESTDLLKRPNDFYGGNLLWKATLTSFLLDGNGYWLKVRNRFGGVVQLWYLPHFLVEPQHEPDDSRADFISHYEYRPRGGELIELPVRDVVHFRYGLDPENPRKGKSPVKPLLREVFTDEEASNFSASILRNMGVPGGVIAPTDKDALPDQGDVEAMKKYMRNAFTGDNRGDWLVLGTPTKTEEFGFDPNRLQLTNLRDISEERVCAALGVPAAVVGFGAGLQQTKVGATMRELRRLAWASCIEPMQTDLAEQLNQQLLPDFQSQLRRFRLRFDSSQVPAFAEEETEKTRRIKLLVEGGILRVDRAQEMLGLEVDPNQDVYLRPQNTTAVGPNGEPVNAPAGLLNGGSPDFVEDENEEEEDEEEVDPETNGVRRSLARASKILERMEG